MSTDAPLHLLVVVFLVIWVLAFVFWIMKLVEVCKIPEHQYRAASADKTSWILVVVLAGVIGAIIWQFARRSAVLAAAGRAPGAWQAPAAWQTPAGQAPPGWYPVGPSGALRWWNGSAWADNYPPPPPAGGGFSI